MKFAFAARLLGDVAALIDPKRLSPDAVREIGAKVMSLRRPRRSDEPHRNPERVNRGMDFRARFDHLAGFAAARALATASLNPE